MTKSELSFNAIPAPQPSSVIHAHAASLPALISVTEFCRCMSIGRTTAYFLMNTGEVEVCRIGRRTLVKVDSIAKFVAARTTSKPTCLGDV